MTSNGSADMSALPPLVNKLASVAARTADKPFDGDTCAAYLTALHQLEFFLHSISEEEWQPAPTIISVVTDIMELALQSAVREPLSCVLLQAWVAVLDGVLQHTPAAVVDFSPYVKRLWEGAQRLTKTRATPASDAVLASVLTFLRAILRRRPVSIECAPKTQLPSPTSTPGVLSRVAALELAPLLVAVAQPTSSQRKASLSWPWLEYLRKAVSSNVPSVSENGVRAIRMILQSGTELDASYINDLIDLLMSLASNGNSAPALENELGLVIGRLLATLQRPGGWSHFGAPTAKGSARIVKLLFDPAKVNLGSKRVLSAAVGELLVLLGSASTESMEKAICCIFRGLLAVHAQNGPSFMPDIVAGAVLYWAKAGRSDTFRSTVVRYLIPFLDAERSEIVGYTALLCLKGVISTVGELDEYAVNLWEELLKQVSRNKDIKKLTSEVMVCVVVRNEWCQRALLRHVFATCCSNNPRTGVDAYLSMMPLFTMHAQALLNLPEAVLRKPCVVSATLAAVARLSVDDSHDALADIFHWCVEYFCLLSRVLLTYQRPFLPPTATTSVRSTLRVFLGALVSNAPTAGEVRTIASAHARATVAACDLLSLVEPGDTELKLVVALLETLDDPIVPVAVPRVRGAVYRLLSCLPWDTCHDDAGKRRAVTLALDDMGEAVRLGVPCAPDEETEGSVTGGGNDSNLKNIKVYGFELLPCVAAVGCLGDQQCMKPTLKQAVSSTVTRSAIQLIAAASAAGSNAEAQGGCLLPSILVNMRHWRQIKSEAPAAQAWNILCCLNAIISSGHSNCRGEDDAATIVAKDSNGEWLNFISTNWLGHDIWAVRLLAARVLARLALASGGVDAFTSSVVNRANMSPSYISGAVIALGFMHGSVGGVSSGTNGKVTTSGMAMSFITRMLGQYGLRGSDEGVKIASSVLIALIHLSKQQRSLVESVVQTSLAPQLILYQESQQRVAVSPMNPFITVLLFDLVNRLSLHKNQENGSVMAVFGASVVLRAVLTAATTAALTTDNKNNKCGSTLPGSSVFPVAMPEHSAAEVLKTVRNMMESSTQTTVSVTVLQKCALQGLGNTGYLSDIVSCAVANVTTSSKVAPKVGGPTSLWLLRVAELVDTATTVETRLAWTKVVGMIMNDIWQEPLERNACLQSMNLIIRGKPAQLCGTSAEEDEVPARGDLDIDRYDGEARGTSLAKGVAATAEGRALSSEAQSKAAVLTVLVQMLSGDLRVELNGDVLPQFLQLLLSAVALAEVSPCLVQLAADALRTLLRKYGNCTKDGSTPFLQPWKVLLINGMVHVIERCVYCSATGSALAEEFFASNVSDDTSARRVLVALMQLLTQLGQLDASHAEVSHGCSGRVVLAIARCSATASMGTQSARWPQTSQRAREALTASNAQTVVAHICNQLVSAITLAHGYEPPHGMVPTPLDVCTYVTPAAAMELLLQLHNASRDVDSTVSYAAGLLVVLLLAVKMEETVVPRPALSGVSLEHLRSLVPLLTPSHCETLLDTVLALLPAVLLKEAGMKEGEKMEELLEISATAASVAHSSRCASTFMPADGGDGVHEKRRNQVEQLISMLVAENHSVLTSSLAPLTLTVHSNCIADCIVEVLRKLDANVLLSSKDKAATLALQLCHRFPARELQDIAQSSVCALLLLMCRNESQQKLEMLKDPVISPSLLAHIGEALVQTKTPVKLIEYMRHTLSRSTRVCGVFLAVCTAVRQQQQYWPCVEAILLSSIYTDNPEEPDQGAPQQAQLREDDATIRVAFFVRSLISLSHFHGNPKEVHSRYPKATAALTEQIMRNHAAELKSVIQSLQEGDAVILRELMQLHGSAAQRGPVAVTNAAAAPQRLKINLSSFT